MIKLQVRTDYTTIETVPIRLSQILDDQLRYLSPNATSYNPAYLNGYWDGFVRLYDVQRRRFPTGLLRRVKGILQSNGYEFDTVSMLPDIPQASDALRMHSAITIRDYQQAAVQAALHWRRGIISIPTGGGKTEVAQSILDCVGASRCVFLVPSRAILRQTVRRMVSAFPNVPVLQFGDGSRPPDVLPRTYICVATVQSCFKTPHPVLRMAEAVFVDECHHQAAETFQRATRTAVNARYILGLSATPYRHDGCDMELEAWLGPIIHNTTYEHLIDNGWLVPPEFHAVHQIQDALELTRNMRTMIFSEQEIHLRDYEKVFKNFGATTLTSKSGSRKIESTLREFEQGSITHIACTPLFDEGVDIPDIEAVLFFSTFGVRTRAIQRIGRAMRPGNTLMGEPKKKCIVVDLKDKFYHARLEAYKSEPAFLSRLK